MKTICSRLATAALCTTILFTSCKKEASNNSNEPSETEMNAHADDQNRVSGDMDAINNDLNLVMESNPDFAGARTTQTAQYCNAVAVFDTANQQRRITITYNGDNCFGTHTRQGVVKVTMPFGTRWKDAGAAVTVTYINLKITRKSDNKFITLNGGHTFTNVTGGLLRNLATSGATITHTVASTGMSITFMDGTQRNWQVARKKDFTYSGGLVVSISGTHSANGTNGIAEWGTDRFGRSFTTAITQPIVVKQDCDFRITSGQVTHNRQAVNATVTFGLNQAGSPMGQCPGATNPFYMKIVWTGPNGNAHTHTLPY